jgi:glutamate carboxypeptidase
MSFFSTALNTAATVAFGIASFSLAQTTPATSALTPLESRMAATIDANSVTDRALLEQLVDINSGTMHLAGVVAVKDVLVPSFQALGFRCIGCRWTP